MGKKVKKANGHDFARSPNGDKQEGQKREDIKNCLNYLEAQAAKAGLTEVAHWIGIARLAASDLPKRNNTDAVKVSPD